jgi:hypothetical protein
MKEPIRTAQPPDSECVVSDLSVVWDGYWKIQSPSNRAGLRSLFRDGRWENFYSGRTTIQTSSESTNVAFPQNVKRMWWISEDTMSRTKEPLASRKMRLSTSIGVLVSPWTSWVKSPLTHGRNGHNVERITFFEFDRRQVRARSSQSRQRCSRVTEMESKRRKSRCLP